MTKLFVRHELSGNMSVDSFANDKSVMFYEFEIRQLFILNVFAPIGYLILNSIPLDLRSISYIYYVGNP